MEKLYTGGKKGLLHEIQFKCSRFQTKLSKHIKYKCFIVAIEHNGCCNVCFRCVKSKFGPVEGSRHELQKIKKYVNYFQVPTALEYEWGQNTTLYNK